MIDAAGTPQTIRLSDYRPPAWRVPQVALDFDLGAERTRVTARLTVERNGKRSEPLVLDGQGLTLVSVKRDGVALDVQPVGETLTIEIAGDSAVIETVVDIAPATNTRLMGLYASGGLLCTQCEAEGFRRITFFPDRPDVLSVYDVKMTADAATYPVLLANGNEVATGQWPDGRHWAQWHDPWPKPSYLFALVAGNLSPLRDQFVTASGRKVDLAIWVAADDVPRCAHAMAALKASMRWDEVNYGREYDLDRFNIVAVGDFNFGAMENKGLNIFNSRYILADADTATDADFDAIAAVVAHEYFHNWTGNRITCRDWFQLSLKEGLTVFRDQQFSADQGSAAVRRIDDVRMLRAGQFPEDAGPMAHPIRPDSYIEISNFYTATIYNKGAEVIRMMATLLGPDGFRAGTDLYFDRHDGAAVTTEDFVRAMEDASGVDLAQFRNWYAQAGTPHLDARITHDAAARTAQLHLTQTLAPTPGQPVKPVMQLPLRIALFGGTTGKRLGDERLVSLTEASATIAFDNIDEPPVASLNRGFSAPIIVQSDRSRADLAFLSAHDDDPFARYEALQQLGQAALLDSGLDSGDDSDLVAAIGATLNSGLDAAFIAEAVLLPSEAMAGDAMTVVDVDGLHARREAVRRRIGSDLNAQWWAVYHANNANRYELTPEAKGRRRLRNVALGYLMANDDAEAVATAFKQFETADNMTDRMAALNVLSHSNAPERDAALAAFHARYGDNALVLDKWFSVQAMSTRADTPAAVAALMTHPDFSYTNPNRLRALVGAYAANQVRFNAADGSGYRLVADAVLAVDGLNPQAAARLVSPLGRWKRFDAARAALMRAELERIVATPGLSKDVFEIASKSLA